MTCQVPESLFPINRRSFHKEVYQQLLKLLFLKAVPGARPNVLVMDADVFWLRDVKFISDQGELLYSTANVMNSWSACRTFADGGNGHVEFVAAMLGFSRDRQEISEHAVVHHMMMNRETLDTLFDFVAARVRRTATAVGSDWEPWMLFVELFDAHHTPRSSLYHQDPDPGNLTLEQLHETSEYELYDTWTFSPEAHARVKRRQLRFADVGACCFEENGTPLSNCDFESMHDDLAGIYGLDYVACHGQFRRQAVPGRQQVRVEY